MYRIQRWKHHALRTVHVACSSHLGLHTIHGVAAVPIHCRDHNANTAPLPRTFLFLVDNTDVLVTQRVKIQPSRNFCSKLLQKPVDFPQLPLVWS